MKTWTHPGGKLIEEGAHTLSQGELFEILIRTGYDIWIGKRKQQEKDHSIISQGKKLIQS